MPDWTQELKDEVIEKYKAANPTPENTSEIVASIANNLGDDFTPNGVMAILIKAKNQDGTSVYIKKNAGTGTKSNGDSKRVNKTEAINSLKDAISAYGLDVDDDIVGKLTGKAAVYFKNIIDEMTE